MRQIPNARFPRLISSIARAEIGTKVTKLPMLQSRVAFLSGPQVKVIMSHQYKFQMVLAIKVAKAPMKFSANLWRLILSGACRSMGILP